MRQPEFLPSSKVLSQQKTIALALNGLHRNQIEFTSHDLVEIIEQLAISYKSLLLTLEQNVNQLSCLHLDKEPQSVDLLSYHFLHLSFQEFFAAQWLVKCLIQDKPLGLFKDPTMKPYRSSIQQYKYHTRYEIVWWFMAGLLPNKALIRFFEALEDPSCQDLIGIQYQRLIMHCLLESQNRLPRVQRKSLESHLKE